MNVKEHDSSYFQALPQVKEKGDSKKLNALKIGVIGAVALPCLAGFAALGIGALVCVAIPIVGGFLGMGAVAIFFTGAAIVGAAAIPLIILL